MSGGDIAALVERFSVSEMAAGLRIHALDDCNGQVLDTHLCNLAALFVERQATAITDLQARLEARDAEVAKLRAALAIYAGPMADREWSGPFPCWADGYPGGVFIDDNTLDFGDIARATLGGEHG